jgi:phage terminase large subunit-like protein
VHRWVMQAEDGPAGLVAERPARGVLDRADPRWLDAALYRLGRAQPGGPVGRGEDVTPASSLI